MDQSSAALELLYETISSKRTRSVSQASLEPIMMRFVELSVALRKGKIVKDGLYQYKKLVQVANVQALEPAVKRFLELSEEKVASAQAKADELTDEVAEDLEAVDSPEDILLSTVSSEQSKDRTDREVVTPWLKFLWEAYRSVLEVLRNNSMLEVLYQQVVKQAFEFCLKYNRKTEFRRLCELLRNHLQSASQYRNSGQPHHIDLSDPETLQRYLDTRFDQLNVAVKLELWQEAFRSVEDVHTLLTVSKRSAPRSTMANYYENLARIFLVSGNQLFHAASLSRYYNLVSQARGVPEAELTRASSLLVLAVLSIPTFSQRSRVGLSDVDDQKNRNARLTGLLNLPRTPSRESLLRTALFKNVLAHVKPEICELYKILEVDFHPLSIKKRLAPVIEKIGAEKDYAPYVKSLYQVILTRLFQQLSQVYKTVKLDFVVGLASFPAPFDASPVEIERFIVMGCQRGEFGIRIDHESASITFKDDIYDDSLTTAQTSAASPACSLQATPSDLVRTRMSVLGKALVQAAGVIDPLYVDYHKTSRQAAVERSLASLARENREILQRREAIVARRKEAEAEKVRREEEEAKARALRIQQEQQAEQQRLAEEERRRELERVQREQEAIKLDAKRRLAEEINARGFVHIDVDKIEEIDDNKLKSIEVEQLSKKNRDLGERMRIISRRMDHLERAYRLEEIPLWEQDRAAQEEADVKAYEARKKAILTKAKQDHVEALALRDRLKRIVPEYQTFRHNVEEKRKSMFEAKRKENARLLEEEKQKRIAQVKAQREAEARRRKAEEEERIAREERAREEEKARENVYRPGRLGGAGAGVARQAPPSMAAGPGPAEPPRNVYRPGALRSSLAASGDRSADAPPARAPASRPSASSIFGAAAGKPVQVEPRRGEDGPASRTPSGAGSSIFGASAGRPASYTSAARNADDSSAPAPERKPPTGGRYVPPSLRR